MKFWKLFFALILVPSRILAGPFGIDVDTFNPRTAGCEEKEQNIFVCTVVKPHPDIETYVFKWVDGLGVCVIKGISEDISDSRYGIVTRSKIDEIAGQLNSKYGMKPELNDFLFTGSIWDLPEDWMMGLLKGERSYVYVWQTVIPVEGIVSVYLAAKNTDDDNGYFVVEFYTAKDEECSVAIAQDDADSF